MKYGRFAAAALAAVMMTGAMPFTVSADETDAKHIVILGDGINAGAGLGEGEQSCAAQICGYLGAEVSDFAQEGFTTADVLQCLEQADVQAALADADVIFVSAGLNDIMDPYIATARGYMEQYGFEQFSDLFTAKMEDYGLTESKLLEYSVELSASARQNKAEAISNILAIGEKLSQYENAEVVYLNVYNPMDTLENIGELSVNRQTAYNIGVYSPINGALNDSGNINPTYNSLTNKYSCTVIDTCTLFKGLAYKYSYPADLNPDLNADGQNLLALSIAETMDIIVYGNLDGDEGISPSDASAVLGHIAAVGAGQSGTLNAVQLAAADVNKDNVVDPSDAAAILVYVAEEGAGGTPSFD